MSTLFQIPHSFQQSLSQESTPSLCDTIPLFEAMVQLLKIHQQKFPETSMIIQEGLDKLSEYIARLDLVPAYTLAMGNFSHLLFHFFIHLIDSA